MISDTPLTTAEQHGILWLLGSMVLAWATVIWFGIRWALVDRAKYTDRTHQLETRIRELEMRVGEERQDGIRGDILALKDDLKEMRNESTSSYEDLMRRLNGWNNDLQLKFSMLSRHSNGTDVGG